LLVLRGVGFKSTVVEGPSLLLLASSRIHLFVSQTDDDGVLNIVISYTKVVMMGHQTHGDEGHRWFQRLLQPPTLETGGETLFANINSVEVVIFIPFHYYF